MEKMAGATEIDQQIQVLLDVVNSQNMNGGRMAAIAGASVALLGLGLFGPLGLLFGSAVGGFAAAATVVDYRGLQMCLQDSRLNKVGFVREAMQSTDVREWGALVDMVTNHDSRGRVVDLLVSIARKHTTP